MYEQLLAERIGPVFLDLVDGFLEILLRLLFTAQTVHHLRQTGVDLFLDLLVGNGKGVQTGLCQKEFGRDHVLQNLAAGVVVDSITAGLHHPDLLLYVGEENHIVADNGHRLVYQTTGIGLRTQAQSCDSRKDRDDEYR